MLFLIRHANPVIDYSDCVYEEALDRLDDYNETTSVSLKEITSFKKSDSYDMMRNLDPVVYTSPLSRAYLTCDELFDEGTILDDLIEVDMELVNIPYIKLKVKTWFFISRIAWLLRMTPTEENSDDVNLRINRLIKYIHSDEHVALVCHGGLIHYLKRHPYIKNNFKLIHTESHGILTLDVLDRR